MSKNWYPVIDSEKCIECGKCIDMCMHGVYDKKKSPTPIVIFEEGCIEGCKGCGGECPVDAIEYIGGTKGKLSVCDCGKDKEQEKDNCCCGDDCDWDKDKKQEKDNCCCGDVCDCGKDKEQEKDNCCCGDDCDCGKDTDKDNCCCGDDCDCGKDKEQEKDNCCCGDDCCGQ